MGILSEVRCEDGIKGVVSMDAIIGLIVMLVVGILLIVVTMIISWWMNERMDQGQCNDDSDIRIYHFVRDREHRGLDRHYTKGGE